VGRLSEREALRRAVERDEKGREYKRTCILDLANRCSMSGLDRPALVKKVARMVSEFETSDELPTEFAERVVALLGDGRPDRIDDACRELQGVPGN
jgi:hypothetical protein